MAVLKTALAVGVVMGAFYGWIAFVRRRSGSRQDRDVLEHMAHGCAGCKSDGACRNRKVEEVEKEQHEPA